MQRVIDAWGRRIFSAEDAVELLFCGCDIDKVSIAASDDLDEYNNTCLERDKLDHLIQPYASPDCSPEADAARRQRSWTIPPNYRDLDVRQKLLALCQTPAQIERVNQEMDLFERRELLPVLRLMCFLVDHWRTNKVLWGVGRGSSVASYCLFLIGIHRINSEAYNLDFHEFLK